MVERNLAKVEVESSSLFSRSNSKASTSKCWPFLLEMFERYGAVTKRLCTGLQIRLARFDSGPRLHKVIVISLLKRGVLFDNAVRVGQCISPIFTSESGVIGSRTGLKIPGQ